MYDSNLTPSFDTSSFITVCSLGAIPFDFDRTKRDTIVSRKVILLFDYKLIHFLV